MSVVRLELMSSLSSLAGKALGLGMTAGVASGAGMSMLDVRVVVSSTLLSASLLLLFVSLVVLFVSLVVLLRSLPLVSGMSCVGGVSFADEGRVMTTGTARGMMDLGGGMVGLPHSSILRFTGMAGAEGMSSPWFASVRTAGASPGNVVVLLLSGVKELAELSGAGASTTDDAPEPAGGRCKMTGPVGMGLRRVGFDSIGGRGRAAISGWRSEACVRNLSLTLRRC